MRLRLTELHGADARLAWVNVQIRLQPQRIKKKRAKSCDLAQSKVLLRELLRAAARQERIHHLLAEDHDQALTAPVFKNQHTEMTVGHDAHHDKLRICRMRYTISSFDELDWLRPCL
jgi:hypothetical protein